MGAEGVIFSEAIEQGWAESPDDSKRQWAEWRVEIEDARMSLSIAATEGLSGRGIEAAWESWIAVDGIVDKRLVLTRDRGGFGVAPVVISISEPAGYPVVVRHGDEKRTASCRRELIDALAGAAVFVGKVARSLVGAD